MKKRQSINNYNLLICKSEYKFYFFEKIKIFFYFCFSMLIKKLSILNFKNFTEFELEPSPKINCFVGNNGVGKTNLLDAIYYLSFTKSYFNHIDSQSIKYGEDFFMIQGEYERNEKQEIIYCGLQKTKNKTFKRNDKKYSKFLEHIGFLPAVVVTPDDNKLIIGGSEERRKFIDGVISQYDKQYLTQLIRYKRVLAQRNQLFKNFAQQKIFQPESVEVYNQQLVLFGEKIYQKRQQFITDFLPSYQNYYNLISQKNEKVEITYNSQLNNGDFNELLTESIGKDKILQYTTVGIHKDDLDFKLGDYKIKKTGSQGQQKTFLLALKFAQYDVIKASLNIKPILLLDDIFDKLDALRVQQIVKLVADDNFGQIFISHTNLDRLENILSEINTDYKIINLL